MIRWASRAVATGLVLMALLVSYLYGVSLESTSSPAPPKPSVPQPLSAHQMEGKLSPQQRQAMQSLGAMPVVFVENKGQWDAKIRYAITGRAVNIALLDSEVRFQLVKPHLESTDAKNAAQDVLTFSLAFEGAKSVQPKGTEETASKIRYYRGSDQSKWQNAVPTFKSAVYEGLYEGVDLSVRPGPSGLKYEFHVAPKASVEQIVIKYSGVDGLTIDSSGNLRIKTAFGELGDAAPSAWQEKASGGRAMVAMKYRLVNDKSYGFETSGTIDPTLPLIIDPAISWNAPCEPVSPASESPRPLTCRRY